MAAIFLVACNGFWAGEAGKNETVILPDKASVTAFAFDTVINIRLYEMRADSQYDWEEILAECENMCDFFENTLSKTVEGSDVYRINHARGEFTQVGKDCLTLVSEALRYSELSGGVFDITIEPVVSRWNFNSDSEKEAEYGVVPDRESLDEALKFVDYKTVEVKGDGIRIPEGAAIDLGAVAKGYIADRLADRLSEMGVTSAIINLGGNTLCLGQKPVKSFMNVTYEDFRVGIQKPFGQSGETAEVVHMSDASLVTSGTYQRYFEKDGKRYHHILSASDGMPVDWGMDSVSIRCKSSLQADCLSTTVFLLGPRKGMELVESIPDTEAVFIMSDGTREYSQGF